MEGFNLIPQTGNNLSEKDSKTEIEIPENKNDILSENISSIKNKKVKFLNDKKENTNLYSNKLELFFILISIIILTAVFLYNAFLFYQRYDYLKKIDNLSNDFSEISKNIDKQELENFTILNKKLNYIQEKLSKHILFTDIFSLINLNMRSSVQVSEYKVDQTENDLIASYSCVAPAFKDMAEQAEKLIELKKNGLIKSFSLSGLSYEQDTKRVRFTIKILLDKSKFSAINYVNNNKN